MVQHCTCNYELVSLYRSVKCFRKLSNLHLVAVKKCLIFISVREKTNICWDTERYVILRDGTLHRIKEKYFCKHLADSLFCSNNLIYFVAFRGPQKRFPITKYNLKSLPRLQWAILHSTTHPAVSFSLYTPGKVNGNRKGGFQWTKFAHCVHKFIETVITLTCRSLNSDYNFGLINSRFISVAIRVT